MGGYLSHKDSCVVDVKRSKHFLLLVFHFDSIIQKELKKRLHLSVNVFSTKALIGDTIFTSPNRDGTRHFTWSSEPREGLAACSAKGVTSLLSYFKTLSNGPTPGIELATSRSAVKRFTD